MYLLLESNAVASAGANAVFVASVVANPVKSDAFAFRANAVFVASVVANPVKSDVFAFRANAVTSALKLMPYS
jgi:hypothetical protein